MGTKMMKDIKEKWERTKKEDISSINEKLEAEYKVNESLRGKISNQAEKESKLQKEMKSLNDLVLKYQGELKDHQDKANKEKKMRRQSVDNYSDRIVKLQEELNKEKTARLAKEKAMDNMKVTIEGLSTSIVGLEKHEAEYNKIFDQNGVLSRKLFEAEEAKITALDKISQ